MFLLVPAYPGCPGPKAVKPLCVYLRYDVCVQLPTSADSVTLLAFAAERRAAVRRCRSISPAWRAHDSKPAAAACGGRMMGQTDRRTDGHGTVT